MRFIIDAPAAMSWDEASAGDWMAGFKMLDGETLAGLLENYAQVGHRTEELAAQLPDLDAAQPLPPAPWFEAGALWSARRMLLPVIAETAQHASHADIIHESLDGAKSMRKRRRCDSQVDTTHQRLPNMPASQTGVQGAPAEALHEATHKPLPQKPPRAIVGCAANRGMRARSRPSRRPQPSRHSSHQARGPNDLGMGEAPQAFELPHMADGRVPRLVGNRMVTGPFPQPWSPQGRDN